MNTSGRKSAKSRSDTAVQGTNDSSIVSKSSASQHGYFDDHFLQYFVHKTRRRSPLIHRGYYIRAVAVEHAFHTFLHKYGQESNQVISLGAGFDSTFFRLKSNNMLINTKYFEVDFPDLMKRKRALILNNKQLCALLTQHAQDEFYKNDNFIYNSGDYKMLGVDLTELECLTDTLQEAGLDPNIPTLLLSEVAIAYMQPSRSCAIIKWASEILNNAVFVIYEQINPHDAFGIVMCKHFEKLGSPLRSLSSFCDIQSQRQRFLTRGWEDIDAADMNQFYFNVLSPEERIRIENREPFDEYEEWNMKCTHYLLLAAYRGRCCQLKGCMLPANGQNTLLETTSQCPSQSEKTISWIISDNNCEAFGTFGHTVDYIEDSFIFVGGFGERDKQHGRIKGITIYDNKTKKYKQASIKEIRLTASNIDLCERLFHTSTVLRNSCIIVIGGRTSPVNACAPLLISLGQNTEKTTLTDAQCSSGGCHGDVIVEEMSMNGACPCPRWRHSATLFVKNDEEYVYVYGGRTLDCLVLADEYLLKVVDFTWTKVTGGGEGPGARHSQSACPYKDQILLMGGLDQSLTPVNHLHSLNTQSMFWSKLAVSGKLLPRYSHSSHVIGDSLLLVGGVHLTYPPPGVAVVNLISNAAVEYSLPLCHPELPIMLHNHASVITEERHLVIIGGGGNCFSFGTHLNKRAIIIDLDPLLQN